MDQTRRIIQLRPLYEFVERHRGDEEALKIERTKIGKEYTSLCREMTEGIEQRPGFYLWGSYDKNRWWHSIYLGRAGDGKSTNLRNRILEELKDESAFVWRHLYTEEKLTEICERYYAGRQYKFGRPSWARGYRKAGASHIIWVPTDHVDEDVKKIEADLIEATNATANLSRPAPTRFLQLETKEIFATFRATIHAARPDKPPNDPIFTVA